MAAAGDRRAFELEKARARPDGARLAELAHTILAAVFAKACTWAAGARAAVAADQGNVAKRMEEWAREDYRRTVCRLGAFFDTFLLAHTWAAARGYLLWKKTRTGKLLPHDE